MPTKQARFEGHPFLRIGKAPAKRDRRNIQLGYLLRMEDVRKSPVQWDFDADVAIAPIPTMPAIGMRTVPPRTPISRPLPQPSGCSPAART